jgi:hypothetical protein
VKDRLLVNSPDTPIDVITAQMLEPRPLPLGRKEFEEWSDRIISGACIPGGEEDMEAFRQGQKGALCQMIMSAKPTESHLPDAHFIHTLRKSASNQVAAAIFKELHDQAKARTAARETECSE